MKKLSLALALSLLLPGLAAFYAPESARAQPIGQGQSTDPQAAPDTQNATPIVTPDASPALNIMPATQRPPLPPPPETQQSAPSNFLRGDQPISLPQAWRLKALLLFKPNNALDKNSIFAMRLQTPYATAFEAITKKLAGSGINLEAVSFSSGHILLSSPNEKGQFDRAIVALRQASSADDKTLMASFGGSNSDSGTNVRVFCDSRNRSLTLLQLRTILGQVDSAGGDGPDRPGSESL